MAFEVVGGGAPTPEEVAAIAAALQVTRQAREAARVRPASRWRWSGRWWVEPSRTAGRRPDWREAASTPHPSDL